MVNADTARFIVGIAGNVISLFLFLSPAPTFITICKTKSVQQFKPDPYLATVLNCALWVFYGMPFVHPNSMLVITTNGTGVLIESIYLIIFIAYSDWPKRKKVLLILLGELVFLAGFVAAVMIFLHGTKKRTVAVGTVCIILNIAMYASPLTVMTRVMKTKSVKYMPFYLSLSNFVNGCVWFAYSLIRFDYNILIPNALGAISGLIQLILYATYYKTTKWNEDDSGNQNPPDVENPTNIELPNVSAAANRVQSSS